MYGVIYVIENKVNGKKYVGQTTQKLKRRFNAHIYASKNKKGIPLYNAIQKYGQECFFIKTIDVAYTFEELNEKEIFWIKKYTDSENIYNVRPGGTGFQKGELHPLYGRELPKKTREKIGNAHRGKIVSSETRKKLSKASKDRPRTEEWSNNISKGLMGHRSWSKGIKLSEETRKKISNSNKGKKLSDEHKEKISINQKKNNSNARKVICITTNEEFCSMSEASRHFMIGRDYVMRSCKGKHCSGKYQFAYLDEYLQGVIPKRPVNKSVKKCINIDTREVFDSIGDAKRKTGINTSCIINVCKGTQKTAGGYRWQYYEDYLKEKENRGVLNGD